MKTLELLKALRASGVTLTADGDRLKVAGPSDALTASLRNEIARQKSQLLRLLAASSADEVDLLDVPRPDRPAMSLGQERIWSLETRAPGTSRYNLPLAFRVRGPLQADALCAAVLDVVGRHETLRSVVTEDAAGPRLVIRDDADPAVFCYENAPLDASLEWMDRWVETEVASPFDLTVGPLIRVRLAALGPQDHLLTVVMHHFVSDGWSFEVFFDELAHFYDARVSSAATSLAAHRVAYSDFAEWQRRRLMGERLGRIEKFWRDQFDGRPQPLDTPQPHRANQDERFIIRVPERVVAKLEAFSAAESCTPFITAITAYALFLGAATRSHDLVLCSPVAGRDRDELRGLIGYLNNVLPLRLTLDPTQSFRELVADTRPTVLGAHENQDLPFQQIANLPETRRISLTRGMFAYHRQPLRSLRLAGLSVENLPVPAGRADFDVALSMEGVESGVEASLSYRPGALGDLEPAQYVGEFIELLDRACRDPAQLGSDLMESVSLSLAPGTRDEPGPSAHRADRDEVRADHQDSADEAAGPPDPLELQLTVIWERVFDAAAIRPDDNFYDLGGHSLLAVRLLETVEREMGARLPLSTLVDSPTVRQLARHLRDDEWTPLADTLVPLETAATGTPVLLPHSFEGHVFLFRELAKRLGQNHPVYGLQAVGLDGAAAPQRSVEEMAGHYLDLVTREFGDAPIAIAGLCFGVSVGLEMARRRRAAGLEVELILIDSSWEHLMQPSDLGPIPGLKERFRLRARREVQRWRWWWTETIRMATGSLYTRRESAIRRRTANAWSRYAPQPYDGRLTLIRAQETADNPAKQWQVQALDVIAQGDLRTVLVPGHHFKILREPYVAAVADEIHRAITRPANGM